MNIRSSFDLTSYNSFGINVEAEFFTEVRSQEELEELLNSKIAKQNNILILGGGSNILFTKNFEGLVIHNRIDGIEVVEENDSRSIIKAGSGVVWQDLVSYAIENNLGGIENLSLIPGLVGAAPIQNIGAYGVELKEVLVSLEAIDITSREKRIFQAVECNFGYRDSIFKQELKDQYIITSVTLKLSKKHKLNTSYGAINAILEEKGIVQPTIRDVSDAVIEIRRSKLPNPAAIGNAGSFFKNPVIDKIDYEGLKIEFPDIPGYINGEEVKVPAAWLIDKSGWKGYKRENIGVHDKQPLVLVNYGSGSGEDIARLATEIREDVAKKFGIELESEPRII